MKFHLLALLLSSLALAGCDALKPKGEEAEKAKKPDTPSEVPVKTASATRGDISSYLEFDSILETESAVEIHSKTNGLIVEVLAEVGDVVKAGQVLAQLENEVEQVNMKESLSRYNHLKTKFNRIEELFNEKLINQQEYDTETFDLEQAQINYERSRIRYEDTFIRAPVSGIISKRLTQVGERINTSKSLFTLMNPAELFAQINIPGQHMLAIRKGLPAEIVSEIIEGITYKGSVRIISPIIDSASGTFNVKVVVDDTRSMPIYPGMFVNVRLNLDTKSDVVLIPKSALLHEGQETFIFKVENGVARKMPFTPGYSSASKIESTSGVAEGDQIIVLGHNALKDGTQVEIVNETYSAEQTPDTSDKPTEEG